VRIGDIIMNAREISAKYDSSIIVRRWAAVWIDYIILFVILLLADAILGNDIYQKMFILWIAIIIAYFPVLEGITGFTIGKFIVRIKVIDLNCKTPGLIKAIIRGLLRIIEVNPFLAGGAPAGLVVLLSRNRQRFGDMLAKTYVVKVKDIQDISLSNSTDSSAKTPNPSEN
jgi:uncharacterized RDD family membrane protein YckC